MPDGPLSEQPDPTPPQSEEECLDWLRLIRSRRVGAVTFRRLLGEYGTARAALEALPQIASQAGVGGYTACSAEMARAELQAGARIGAEFLPLGAADYPPQLAATPDAPPVLWLQGRRALLQRPMLALVGARNASSLGLRMARRLAFELGEAGYVLVSGLARGIDAEAHQAALGSGTVAVQPGGVDVIWPAENAALAAAIAREGLCLSEHPPGMRPLARHFPARNRIVAGLARAVLVVEAAARSGSLITARLALDLGREVLAVPGHPFDARAAGCNALIREGAQLLRSAADLQGAGLPDIAQPELPGPARSRGAPESRPAVRDSAVASRKPPRLAEITRLHNLILDRLGPSPQAEDQLLRDLALPAAQLLPELLTLELEGRVSRQPGGLIARK